MAEAAASASGAPATPEGSPRWFAALYASDAMRRVLQPLLGIEAEIYAVLRPGLEHSVAHVRMQWWQEECERAGRGSGVHPLTRALLAARPAGGAGADLSGLVDTAVWDLAAATFASRRELTGYCERWAAAVTGLAAHWTAAPGVDPATGLAAGRRLGAALRELELLLELKTAARAGRLRLPLDELARSGVEPADLAAPGWPAPLVALLRERHRLLRDRLQAELATLTDPALGTALRGLRVWAGLVLRHSQLAEGQLPGGWQATRRSRLGDAWNAWRSARRG